MGDEKIYYYFNNYNENKQQINETKKNERYRKNLRKIKNHAIE